MLKRGDGRVEWQRFGDGVRIWLDDAFVDTGHGSARGKLRMVLRPGELPLMDVSATAEGFDVTQLWRYLQTGRMSPKSIRWLDAAFLAGHVTEARVSITGPTKGFPYREGQGVFRAHGKVRGVNLFYAPGWPELRDVDAEFSFDGPALHAVASQGSIGNIAFAGGEVNSGDLREAIYAVRGQAEVDAGRAIRMLQATPLAPSFGAMFADLSGAGPVKADVAMVLPIKNFDRRVVTVMANLDGITLRHRQQPFEVTDVSGDLWVRNREIQAPALAGRALGGRFDASIATTPLANGNLRTLVSASGTVQGSALAPVAHMPVNAGLTGTTEWRGTLDVERNADPKRPARGTVRVQSDLRGLSSGLPEPFAKTAESARPIALAASFDGTGGPRIEGSLGRDVHALLRWRSKADRPAGRARHRPVRRRDTRCAAAVGGPLAGRQPRDRQPDEAPGPEVERAARSSHPGLPRRRRPFDRPLRGARLRLHQPERPAAAGQPCLGRRRRRPRDCRPRGRALYVSGRGPAGAGPAAAAFQRARAGRGKATRPRPAQAAGDAREPRRVHLRPAQLRPRRGGVRARHGRHDGQPVQHAAPGVHRGGPRQLADSRRGRGVPPRSSKSTRTT